MVLKRRKHDAAHRRGNAMVEFALLIPVFMLLIIAILEFARAFQVHQMLVNGAREAARYSVIPGATQASVQTRADNYFTNAGIGDVTVTITPAPESTASGETVTVTASVPWSEVSLGISEWFTGDTLSETVTMRKE